MLEDSQSACPRGHRVCVRQYHSFPQVLGKCPAISTTQPLLDGCWSEIIKGLLSRQELLQSRSILPPHESGGETERAQSMSQGCASASCAEEKRSEGVNASMD